MNFKTYLCNFKGKVKKGWNKHGQVILAVVAAGSAVGAVITAIKASPDAVKICEEHKAKVEEIKETSTEDVKKDLFYENVYTLGKYAKVYAPTISFLILSVGATACGYKVSVGKYATILGAYKTLQGKHKELEQKARETFGDKKVDQIKNLIVKDHLNETNVPENVKFPAEEDWEKDSKGNVLPKNYPAPCFDDWGKRIFPATRSQIEKAIIKVSQRLKNGRDEYANVSMIYKELDENGLYLPTSTSTDDYGWVADDLEWNKEYGCKVIPFAFTSIIKDEYEQPVLCLELDPKIVNME